MYSGSEKVNAIRSWARNTSKKRKEAAGKNFFVKDVLDSYRVGNMYWDAYNSCLIDNPSIDHIVPISRGGTHFVGNLCLTDSKTNSSKHATPLIVWMAKRAALAL